MDILSAIEEMQTKTGTSQASLADALGRTRQSLSNMFRNKTDVRVGTLVEMARAMGYDLVLRKGGDEIEITPKCKDDR